MLERGAAARSDRSDAEGEPAQARYERAPLVHLEDELAEHLPRLERLVGEAGAPQREPAIDRGAQPTIEDERERLEQIPLRAHGRAQHLDLAEEYLPQIDLRREACGGAAGHDAAAPGRGGDAPLEEL